MSINNRCEEELNGKRNGNLNGKEKEDRAPIEETIGADGSFDAEGFESDEIVMLMGDDGEEKPFRIIATLKLDDTDYALLTDDEDFEDTGEIMIFRLVEREGELVFEGVEDDDEIDSVLLAANELFEEGEAE